MRERTEFPYNHADVDIIGDDAGHLFIETSADYGDSYTGWGSASKTIHMDREQVRQFRDFLNRILEWSASTVTNGERT